MALYFPGAAGNYLSIGDVAPFNPAGAFTAYVRFFPLTTNQGCLLTKWQGSADRSFLCEVSGTAANWNILASNLTGYNGNYVGAPLKVGQWNDILFVATGSALYVILNGSRGPSGGQGAPIQNSSIGVKLGMREDLSSEPFKGYVACVATWNAALTVTEAWALMRGQSPPSILSAALSGWWPVGSTTIDLGPAHVGGWTTAGSVPSANPPMELLSSSVWAAETGSVPEVDPPYLTIGVTGLAPTLVGPVPFDAPFLDIGVTPFAPGPTPVLSPPFLTIGTVLPPVFVLEGELPPFVPPALPPTIPPGTPEGPGVPLPPLSSGGLAGIRFYQGPPWRWLVTDLDSNTITFLDKLATGATVTYKLDGGSSAKLTVPSSNPEVNILHDDGDPFVSEGNRLLYGFRREGGSPVWKCRFAGKILQVEDTGQTENALTVITAFDPWHILFQRPMVNVDGEFPDTAGFFSFDDTQVGVIALTFIRNTILNHGAMGVDIGSKDFATVDNMPGTVYWGSPYVATWSGRRKSKYEATTQVDTDCQQGMMVAEVWKQQIDTGAVDLLLTPIYDPVRRPGYMAELSIYEKLGVPADDAVFAWDKPSSNLVQINSLKDGTKRANTIRYYRGQGGQPVDGGIPISYGPSILKYGETWHQQYFPGRVEAAVLALEQLELELLQDGIRTVTITPTSERMPFLFTEWWLGDTVPVYASSRLRAPVAGYQRIYGIVLNIDENSYEQVPQVLVSPDTA